MKSSSSFPTVAPNFLQRAHVSYVRPSRRHRLRSFVEVRVRERAQLTVIADETVDKVSTKRVLGGTCMSVIDSEAEAGHRIVHIAFPPISGRMAEHPSFTLAGLSAAGGTAGYLRTRSTPSLVAGLVLGASYGYAGYRIKQNQDYGTELALGNSVVLLGSATPRIVKTRGRAPVPVVLGVMGALATWYYQKRMREFRYGV